jgi:hypothetical protein
MQADGDAFDVDGGGGDDKALWQRWNNSDNQSKVIETRFTPAQYPSMQSHVNYSLQHLFKLHGEKKGYRGAHDVPVQLP